MRGYTRTACDSEQVFPVSHVELGDVHEISDGDKEA
jgi:hypothetical protein